MNEDATERWHSVRLATEALSTNQKEELGLLLMDDFDVSGTELNQDGSISVFLLGSRTTCQALQELVSSKFDIRSSVSELPEENWVGQCAAVWESVTEGRFTITPYLKTEADTPPAENDIRIYPGTGFGTGHHHTTRMLIGLLQSSTVSATNPASCLDVGTGSGILAIVAHRLFQIPVDAFDPDPLATGNAAINTRINFVDAKIALATTTIDSYTRQYDLVIANLYAELLISMHEKLIATTAVNGTILVSGILEHLWPAVEEVFCAAGCTLTSKLVAADCYPVAANENVWVAGVFVRKPV